MNPVAMIPFATALEDDRALHIARGLSQELADWLRTSGTETVLLTGAHTDEDGAWRRLVTFREEPGAGTAAEWVTGVADEHSNPVTEFKLAVTGELRAPADLPPATFPDRGLRLQVSVVDVGGAFHRLQKQCDAAPGNFAAEITALFGEVANALELKPAAAYEPGTANYKAWLNLLITRSLTVAAEVGAVDREQPGLYEPALEAVRLDPKFSGVRDRLGELCTVLVLERGFEARDAVGALDNVMARVGPDWKSHNVRGHLMMAAGEPSQAARAFCQLLSGKYEAPDSSDKHTAALMAGKAFNMAERPLEAQRVLGLAMQSENLRVDAIVESANSSHALGESAVAERLWRRAIEIDPRSAAAHVQLARMYRSRGDTEKAAQQYAALIELPGLPRSMFADAAEFFVMNEQHARALKAAERYADEYPGDAIAHVLLASALNPMGMHERALKALEKAEVCVGADDLDPLILRQRRYAQHPETEKHFHTLARKSIDGDAADAEAGLRELIKAFPDFWEAHMFLGIALRRQDRWAEARDVLELLHKNQPLPGIDKELTGIYSHLGDPGKALECARRALDQAPEDPTLLTNFAAALLENNQVDEAAKYARRAEMYMPGDEVTLRLLSLIEARMGKRGLLRNFAALVKEATGWFRKKK